jgi:diguanylate cyclase (GGDEF)-like protein
VRSFRLASNFWPVLILAKMLALLGGYLYIALGAAAGRLDAWHGPMWLFCGSYIAFALANIILFSRNDLTPDGQEKQLLGSVGLDFVSVGYLFLFHPSLLLVMLLGLSLLCGLYNFLLPRASGILVAVISALLFAFAMLVGPAYRDSTPLSSLDLVSMALLGAGAIGSASVLARRLKRAVDSIYSVTEELALDLSSQVVEGALNVDELTQRNREVRTMLSITENLVSVLEWDDLFKRIVDAFRNRFEFDKFCIYAYDAEHERLELKDESGAERATGVAKTLKPTQGVVGWCYSHNKGVMIADVTKDERYTRFNERGKRIRSLICQPLVFRGEQLGVVCLDSERVSVFNDNSFEFLERVSPLISIAVANSRSYSEVKTASNTDNLTGLKNHRGFMDKFLPLLDDSYCDGFPLAVLTMDIDNFKGINDTYGHLIGNLILTDLAQILTSFFRQSDLVARFGGEEFVVVLNSTPPDIAPRITEQLRKKVESHKFPITLERDTFKQVTLSIGLATTLDTNLEPEIVSGSRGRGERDRYLKNAEEIWAKLIDNADQAMYTSKREGKNTVRLSHCYPVHIEGVKVVLSSPPPNGPAGEVRLQMQPATAAQEDAEPDEAA